MATDPSNGICRDDMMLANFVDLGAGTGLVCALHDDHDEDAGRSLPSFDHSRASSIGPGGGDSSCGTNATNGSTTTSLKALLGGGGSGGAGGGGAKSANYTAPTAHNNLVGPPIPGGIRIPLPATPVSGKAPIKLPSPVCSSTPSAATGSAPTDASTRGKSRVVSVQVGNVKLPVPPNMPPPPAGVAPAKAAAPAKAPIVIPGPAATPLVQVGIPVAKKPATPAAAAPSVARIAVSPVVAQPQPQPPQLVAVAPGGMPPQQPAPPTAVLVHHHHQPQPQPQQRVALAIPAPSAPPAQPSVQYVTYATAPQAVPAAPPTPTEYMLVQGVNGQMQYVQVQRQPAPYATQLVAAPPPPPPPTPAVQPTTIYHIHSAAPQPPAPPPSLQTGNSVVYVHLLPQQSS